MASPDSSPANVAPAFLARFRQEADHAGRLTFERFMELALYDPQVGYYRGERDRVGRAPGTDFYTASSLGPAFGELLSAACGSLLQDRGLSATDHTFVEIGAETASGVLAGVDHRFRHTRTVRLGEPLDLAGPCVVFSNELFDAQPCRRFLATDGRWWECGVSWDGTGFSEVLLNSVEEAWLPPPTLAGQRFDAPRAAAALMERIVSPAWTGLLVAFDYGKSFDELAHATPAGTARAYWQHTQSNDLLARPSEQDLTCHVCWDWLSAPLSGAGFGAVTLESQESFFIHHAQEFISHALAVEGGQRSARKRAWLELLHPGNLGQKFQVLHATRGVTPDSGTSTARPPR